MKTKKYIVVVQCHIVKERCSGYLCEYAFHERSGGFESYSKDQPLRFLSMTCGGCCGRAVQRKLMNLVSQLNKKEGIEKEEIAIHLSSCIAFDSHHGPECPHKEYLIDLIKNKCGLDLYEGSRISKLTEKRRAQGVYAKR